MLTACGVKEVVQTSSQISTKDYPYISKFHEGIRLKTKGRVEEAIAKLEECLLIRQDDDAVYYALSQLELMSNDLTKSAEYILRAAELDPDNTWYIQELAYMHYEQGNFEQSAESFKKLVDIEPRNVDWQYGYAEVLVRIGESEKAIEALNKTEDQVGINPELSVQKYKLFMDIKKADRAIAEIERARAVFPSDLQLIATLVDHYFKFGPEEKGMELLHELIKNDPNNGRAHLALADIHMSKGNKEEAYTELALAFKGEGVEVDTKMQVLLSLLEASFKVEPEVLELVHLMVAAHPEDAKSHSVLGDYLLRMEKEEEALAAYKKALEYETGEFVIWNQVLIMEYQASKFEDLYVDSKECLTLFPTISTVYLLYGVSSNQLKKFDEAIEMLSAGIELVVSDKQMEAEFLGQIGEAHFGLNEIKEAKDAYTRAIELDKFSSLLKSNFAYQLAMTNNDLSLAQSLIDEANLLAPNQAQFIDTYGFVLFVQGKYDEALKKFERAYDLNKEDYMILDHLGDAKFKNGDVIEAIEFWKKALELGSKNKNLSKKIQEKKFYEPLF